MSRLVAATGKHFAFTYDKASGVGSFFVDGRENAAIDGEDDRALVWGAETTDILVGIGLDGGSAPAGGTMDEIRISDTALSAADFLNAEQFHRHRQRQLPDDHVWHGRHIHSRRSPLQRRIEQRRHCRNHRLLRREGVGRRRYLEHFAACQQRPPTTRALTHNLLSGELDGAAQLKAKDPRTIDRQLDTTIPEASTYYMSALLHATETEEINLMSVGFLQ